MVGGGGGIDQANGRIRAEIPGQFHRQLHARRKFCKALVDAELEVEGAVLMAQHDCRGHRRFAGPQRHDLALAGLGQRRGSATDESRVAIVLAERGAALALPAAGLQHQEWFNRGADVGRRPRHVEMDGAVFGEAIALTAQFVGLFGTAIKLLDWFRAYIGNKHTHVLLMFSTTAESLVPTAAGLLVGIVAVWWFNWRSDRLAVFNGEMEIAARDLVKYLEQQRRTGKL